MDQQKIDGFFRMIISIYGRGFPVVVQESLTVTLENKSHQDALEVLRQLENDDDLSFLPTPKRIRRMFAEIEERRLEADADRDRNEVQKGTRQAFLPRTEHGRRSLELIAARMSGEFSEAQIFAKLKAMAADFPGFGWEEQVKSFELKGKSTAA